MIYNNNFQFATQEHPWERSDRYEGKQLKRSFFAPKWDKQASKRYAIPSPRVDFCLIVVIGKDRTKKLLQKCYFSVNISTLLLTLLTHGAITVACSGGRAKEEPQGPPESSSEWTLQIFCPDPNAGIGGMIYVYADYFPWKPVRCTSAAAVSAIWASS